MWEYIIGYGPAQGDAPWVIEERSWAARSAMLAEMRAEGWELHAEEQHRDHSIKVVLRRPYEPDQSAPRHLMPCW